MQSWMEQNNKLILKCAAAWVCKNSKTHCTSSLCSFLLSLVSVFFTRESKRRAAPQEQYQSTLTMFFYSSLYSFNTSKPWPALVTCNYGIFMKHLHVGHSLWQTFHSYWFKSRVWRIHLVFQWEFTLCFLLSDKHVLKWYWLKSKSRFIMSVKQTKNSGQVVSSPIVQSCLTAYITKNNMFGIFANDFQIFDE